MNNNIKSKAERKTLSPALPGGRNKTIDSTRNRLLGTYKISLKNKTQIPKPTNYKHIVPSYISQTNFRDKQPNIINIKIDSRNLNESHKKSSHRSNTYSKNNINYLKLNKQNFNTSNEKKSCCCCCCICGLFLDVSPQKRLYTPNRFVYNNKKNKSNDKVNNKMDNKRNYTSKDKMNYKLIIKVSDKIKDRSNDKMNYKANYKINHKISPKVIDKVNHKLIDITNYKVKEKANDKANDKINYTVNDKLNDRMNHKLINITYYKLKEKSNYKVNDKMYYTVNDKVNDKVNHKVFDKENNKVIDKANHKVEYIKSSKNNEKANDKKYYKVDHRMIGKVNVKINYKGNDKFDDSENSLQRRLTTNNIKSTTNSIKKERTNDSKKNNKIIKNYFINTKTQRIIPIKKIDLSNPKKDENNGSKIRINYDKYKKLFKKKKKVNLMTINDLESVKERIESFFRGPSYMKEKKECELCHKKVFTYSYQFHLHSHPTRILNWMFCGTFLNANNNAEIKALDIKYILNCAIELKLNNLPKYVKYCQLNILDDDSTDITLFFDKAFSFIEEARKSNQKILIHCRLGISRSPALIIGYFIKYMGYTTEAALNLLISQRSQIHPNSGFISQLKAYEKNIKKIPREKINSNISHSTVDTISK
jgi:protein-tyrosine phosphatase